jgi:hypothetical protein
LRTLLLAVPWHFTALCCSCQRGGAEDLLPRSSSLKLYCASWSANLRGWMDG